MGFMKFLSKKDKGVSNKDELDIPPLPPPVEGPDKDLGLTSIGEDIKLGDMKELPPFPSPTEENEMKFPEIPPVDSEGLTGAPIEEAKAPEEPIIPEPPKAPEPVFAPTIPKIQPEAAPIEKPSIPGQPIFVEVGKYKNVLSDLGKIKSDLNKANDALVELEQNKEEEDKEFSKWHSCLEDMHNKLSIIDKVLSTR